MTSKCVNLEGCEKKWTKEAYKSKAEQKCKYNYSTGGSLKQNPCVRLWNVVAQWGKYHQNAGGYLICLLCSTDDCHQWSRELEKLEHTLSNLPLCILVWQAVALFPYHYVLLDSCGPCYLVNEACLNLHEQMKNMFWYLNHPVRYSISRSNFSLPQH